MNGKEELARSKLLADLDGQPPPATISTGQPSTLKTYLGLARIFGDEAVSFVQKKIDESERGEEEEVIADESQMLYLLSHVQSSGELPDGI